MTSAGMAIITLTSDIGLQDYLVGSVKGMLHESCPDHEVIDISHEIAPFDFPQAVYLTRSALPWFPPGTCHFILVNLFDHKNAPYLLCYHKGHYFLCADNGLITMILNGTPEKIFRLHLNHQGFNTLHVIRQFADTTAALGRGIPPEELGEAADTLIERNPLQPILQADYIEGQVIYIDRFENVVVNITRDQFEACRKGRSFRIFVMRDDFIGHISQSYSDVPEGGKLAMFNTAGYLEIAINKGNAAGLFGLQSYSRDLNGPGDAHLHKHLFYQTIRIHFE